MDGLMTAPQAETNEQYHADTTHVSASMLKTLDESPRVFEAKYITRELLPLSSPSIELGTAVHCAALEPDQFDQLYAVPPEGCEDRRRTPYKKWAETVGPSRTILRRDQVGAIRQCVEKLRQHPIVALALEADGQVETSHRWQCDLTGVKCKFRPDKICQQHGVILDIKTMHCCDQAEFEKQLIKFRYFLQAAHYLSGAAAAYERDDWMFVFGCVETSPPFRCRAFQLDAETLAIGRDEHERLLVDYGRRLKAGDWSERDEREIVEVSVPHWYWRKNK